MSGSDSRTRLTLLDELTQIVAAMKNLAYAELQRLAHLLEAQQAAEQAMQSAVQNLWPSSNTSNPNAGIWLATGSERGFCGGFNDQMADAVLQRQRQYPDTQWFIAGERLRQRLEDHLPQAYWLPSSNSSEDYQDCIELWTEALTKHLFTAPLYTLLHTEQGIQQHQLLYFSSCQAPTQSPKHYLTLEQLQPPLLLELLRIQLLGVQFQSLQQENLARLTQMKRAQDHLDETRQDLHRQYFRQRQSEITSELETLMLSLTKHESIKPTT